MRKEIEAFLGPLDGELTPIREIALRHVNSTAKFDDKTGALLLGHTPEVGSEARTVVLFRGLTNDQIDRYCDLQGKAQGGSPSYIPNAYRQILMRMNGAHLAGMSLYGIPTSMLNDPPLLDRLSWQPIDFATSNQPWHRRINPSYCSIGASYWTYDDNVEYFLEPTGHVGVYLRTDELVDRYSSVQSFLSKELARLEASLPERNRLEAERRSLDAKAKSTALGRLRSWLFGNP